MNKTNLLLIALVSILIALAGCGKTNYSIVGVWSENSIRELSTRNGYVIDTTIQIAAGYNTLTYRADGTFQDIQGGYSNGAGTYTLAGSKITTFYTGAYASSALYITRLDANSLVVQHTDTVGLNPLATRQYIFSYTRQ